MSYIVFYIALEVSAQAVTMLHMLYLRRNHSTILAWFMVILFFPFPAFFLYFIFGNRKIRQKSKKKELLLHGQIHSISPLNPIEILLESHAIAPATVRNEFNLCFDGVSAYESLLNEITKAHESIWISTFIVQNDSVAQTILEALTQKAMQGIEVKLLIDAVGSYRLYLWQRPLQRFREAGGEVVFFMPILKDPFKNYINLRNHRKIYLFDGRTVLAGGMNLGEEYLGPNSMKKRWIDMIFRIEGEAAFLYAEIFAADFEYATGKAGAAIRKETRCGRHNAVQVVPSGPDIASDALYETLLSAIHSALHKIWIITPYFVPDETILRALIIAKHKGVDVRLITPGTSNWVSDMGRSSYMREAQENGIGIYLYKGPMLHAKAVLFDEYALMLGSVNIDNRSLFLNYEVVSFVYSPSVIVQMEGWMRDLQGHSSTGIKKGSPGRVMMENFMRVFSPQL
ncbi:MAG: phospholipase D-like domain-containing protein [Sulfuricurvum sp.]|uniref:phospholipase D-like domain-containing protein n=1 Tax=Sulfuricurvum sp. TaxID=2025608 RepID=UPI0025F906E1|nr:phospholipase D-like domain-containing protein [Sulfuricurvum sp.]MCK9372635.1 phospholipase D-like domain-containing protein [Sulfuricurvum sp.]